MTFREQEYNNVIFENCERIENSMSTLGEEARNIHPAENVLEDIKQNFSAQNVEPIKEIYSKPSPKQDCNATKQRILKSWFIFKQLHLH